MFVWRQRDKMQKKITEKWPCQKKTHLQQFKHAACNVSIFNSINAISLVKGTITLCIIKKQIEWDWKNKMASE